MNRPTHILTRIFWLPAFTLLCAACTGLQAPQVASPSLYLLDTRPLSKAAPAKRDLVLAVGTPRAEAGFDTPGMAYRRQPYRLDYFANSRWVGTPPQMLEPLLIAALEQTAGFRAIVRTAGPVPANLRLDTELLRLEQDFTTQPSRIRLILRAQLIDVAGKRVIAAQRFDATENAASDDAYGGVIAANRALQRVLAELADFCVNQSVSR